MNSTPLPPIPGDERAWIEGRMRWLLETFPAADFLARDVIVPTEQFFPDVYDQSEEAALVVKERVKSYMMIRVPTDERIQPARQRMVAADLSNDGIFFDPNDLSDPAYLVASIARQLVKLELEFVPGAAESDDYLPLVELATIMHGMGVFTGNSMLREKNWHAGPVSGWSMSRQGWLSFNAFSYALALYARLRPHDRAYWPVHLRHDLRTAFDESAEYLKSLGPRGRNLIADKPLTRFPLLDDDPHEDDGGAFPIPQCNFCGANLDEFERRQEVCTDCRESIDENDRERERLAKIEAERADDYSAFYLIVGAVVVVIVLCVIFK